MSTVGPYNSGVAPAMAHNKPGELTSAKPFNSESKPQSTNPKKSLQERAEKLNQKDRSGKDFTKAGKEVVKEQNREQNGGQTRCTTCGQQTQDPKKHEKGVTPPGNETHVDHIDPKVPFAPNATPGSGTPNNGQVLCRDCNLLKSNN